MMRPFLLILLAGCAGDTASKPTAAAPNAPQSGAEQHAGHGGADHAAMGHRAPDHMVKMAATREALRVELKQAYDAPVPGLDTADKVKGKAAYDTSCASCHGAAGKGDGSAAAGLEPIPSDLTDAFHARYYSDAGRIHLIKKGSPGTAMAGFEGTLSSEAILEVYAYVRTLRGE